ncbi:MAG TPA: ABC transporter permease [Halomonas campaniensis]|uniref:Transport permease protein n=1 Tax=Halomonas campaniensis TaxID=213554 RepID=A0A3D0KL44_9GAMM|nr:MULTISPECIES: ABC transporter permease [unclassified Halomonas]HBS82007.1 ABC transporter permease [Halomonas campaniensis]HCA04233.1 ABC transporter permease [Halomonas campaniensis]
MANVRGAPKGARTPWQVTRSVWYAMFMREALSRTMADRMGWFWMIFEPVAMVGIMVAIRSFIRGGRLVVNAEFIPWLIAGLMGFFLVREGMLRGMGAIEGNSALFAYRQVQPIDPVLVRNFLEGMLRSFVFLIFIGGGLMLGLDMYPDNAVRVMAAWLSLWCLGLGLGLVTSVAATLVPEVGRVIRMLSLPLLIISGVILPLNQLPHWLLEYLMLNPIPHGLETLRLGFFENYEVVHGTSMLYFWLVTLSLNALGLVMHLRFVDRLKAK